MVSAFFLVLDEKDIRFKHNNNNAPSFIHTPKTSDYWKRREKKCHKKAPPKKNKTNQKKKRSAQTYHMGGGLFDALPPVSSTKSTRDDEDEGAGEDGAKNQSCDRKKKQKINERDDVIETRREPSPTTQKEEKRKEPSPSTMDDWLEKLAKHANRKFETCSRAFLELLSKPDALERKHGKKIVLVMRKTMETHPQSEEYRKETASVFFSLFEAVERLMKENGTIGANVKVTSEMRVWELYCRIMHEIATSEDSFALNGATKRLKKAFEEAPKMRKEEKEEEKEEEQRRKIEIEIEENKHIPKEEKGEALKCALKALEVENASAREVDALHSKICEALIDCLAVAESSMRTKMWARPIVDQLFDFVEKLLASHDYDVFNHTHKERIVSLFKKVKDNANKSASSAKAGVDWVSDFEKHSSRFSKSAVSVRGSVGGESTKDGRGDGKFGER